MAKFGRYDSSNKKKNQQKQNDGFKRIKDSDKGFSRSNEKVFLKTKLDKFLKEDE